MKRGPAHCRAWARFELTSGDRSAGMAKWEEAKQIFERLGAELEVQKMEDNPPLPRN